jgi:hypothetical protein
LPLHRRRVLSVLRLHPRELDLRFLERRRGLLSERVLVGRALRLRGGRLRARARIACAEPLVGAEGELVRPLVVADVVATLSELEHRLELAKRRGARLIAHLAEELAPSEREGDERALGEPLERGRAVACLSVDAPTSQRVEVGARLVREPAGLFGAVVRLGAPRGTKELVPLGEQRWPRAAAHGLVACRFGAEQRVSNARAGRSITALVGARGPRRAALLERHEHALGLVSFGEILSSFELLNGLTCQQDGPLRVAAFGGFACAAGEIPRLRDELRPGRSQGPGLVTLEHRVRFAHRLGHLGGRAREVT